MNKFVSLTQVAQKSVAAALGSNSLAVDATVGNGHDTLFLARSVAPGGHVAGFDIQPRALQDTRNRLAEAGLVPLTTLHLSGHQHMLRLLPADWPGMVSAVMFNLGYLPGGDKTHTTMPDTTRVALDQALSLLRVGGLISVLVYRGHAGAHAEAAAVTEWVEGLDRGYRISCHDSPGPVLHLIERTA